MSLYGLIGMGVGSFDLTILPTRSGIPGYIAPHVVITAGYAQVRTKKTTSSGHCRTSCACCPEPGRVPSTRDGLISDLPPVAGQAVEEDPAPP